ncbi:DUF2474 family protein [Sphingobium boeckii]|nr:DUF2474 family protein [Sphingobium boeckii]
MAEAPPPAPVPLLAPLWRRLGWMALIWLGSIAVVGAVAMVIRFWLKP